VAAPVIRHRLQPARGEARIKLVERLLESVPIP
jgi:hypothetical protein